MIGVDWRIPIDEAWEQIGFDCAVQGNLDPTLLLVGAGLAWPGLAHGRRRRTAGTYLQPRSWNPALDARGARADARAVRSSSVPSGALRRSVVAFILLFVLAFRRPKVVPGKFQALMEAGIEFVREQVIMQMIGPEGLGWLPLPVHALLLHLPRQHPRGDPGRRLPPELAPGLPPGDGGHLVGDLQRGGHQAPRAVRLPEDRHVPSGRSQSCSTSCSRRSSSSRSSCCARSP